MGRILWLASYPKSGNTWMRAFLHNVVHDRGGPLDLGAISKTALMDAGRRYYEPFVSRPLDELSHAEIAALRGRVQKAMSESRSGTVMVKTHSTLGMLGGEPSHDPALTAGALHMVRDPRDVAISYADHLGLTIDEAIATMAVRDARTDATENGVTEFIGSWSQNVTSWADAGAGQVLTVRYEDMLAAPRPTFGKVVAFLHLDVPSSVVRKAIENTSFRRLSAQEKRTGFKERSPRQEKFFRRGQAGGWRAILSDAQRRRIEADHGPVMRRFGYLGDEDT